VRTASGHIRNTQFVTVMHYPDILIFAGRMSSCSVKFEATCIQHAQALQNPGQFLSAALMHKFCKRIFVGYVSKEKTMRQSNQSDK